MSGNLVPISRADDPRVADYLELKEGALARRSEAFIAESPEVVRRAAAQSRFPLSSLFLAEPRVEQLAEAIAQLPAGTPVYVAPQAVMNEVVGFNLHRGCLAAGRRLPAPDPAALLEGARTVVILEALANHDNVGVIFRSAAAFGADLVLLDPRSADPLYRKAIRTSIGTSLVVPFTRLEPWPRALAALHERGFTTLALTPRADALPLEALVHGEVKLPERVALLLGTEGTGLTDEALEVARLRVKITMPPGLDSLNVASTASIALFALDAARRRPG